MATEVAVYEEREPERGVALQVAGMAAMAELSETDFEARLLALKRGSARIERIKRELMAPEIHYGVIPGAKKPTLMKPGAEVLCSIYGLRPDFVPKIEHGDGVTRPHIRVVTRCEMHLGDLTGPVVAVGYGTCSTWEVKYRYRRGERNCPECGVSGSIRQSGFADRDTGEKGWYCRECRAKFRKHDPSITEQQAGTVENPDPYDTENTVVKMSEKRAFLDTTLRATASSDLFTQDLEDMAARPEAAPAPTPRPATVPAGSSGQQGHDDPFEGPLSEREPGSDDVPDWAEAEPAKPAARSRGKKACPPCPQGHPAAKVMESKREPGTYYCHECKKGFK